MAEIRKWKTESEPHGQQCLLLLLFQNSSYQVAEEQLSYVHNKSKKYSDNDVTQTRNPPLMYTGNYNPIVMTKEKEK